MTLSAKDFFDHFVRRMLTDSGQASRRKHVEGVDPAVDDMQGCVAAAIDATCAHLNDPPAR